MNINQIKSRTRCWNEKHDDAFIKGTPFFDKAIFLHWKQTVIHFHNEDLHALNTTDNQIGKLPSTNKSEQKITQTKK